MILNKSLRLDDTLVSFISRHENLYKSENILKLPQELQNRILSNIIKTESKNIFSADVHFFIHSLVRELDLASPFVGDDVFQIVSQRCNNLRNLVISTSTVGSETLKQIVTNNPYLEELIAEEYQNIDSEVISNCRNLNRLSLGSLNHLSFMELIKSLTLCKNLTTLDVGVTSITDEGLTSVVESCNSLISLNITSCLELSVISLQSIAKNLPHLQILNMSWTDTIHSIHPLTSLTEFRSLALSYISDQISPIDMGIILQKNKKLNELYLSNSCFINGQNLEYIGRLNLKKLILSKLLMTDSENFFQNIAKCSYLEVLDVSFLSCSSWLRDVVKELHFLKYLDLDDTDIDVSFVLELVDILPNTMDKLDCKNQLITTEVLQKYRKKISLL